MSIDSDLDSNLDNDLDADLDLDLGIDLEGYEAMEGFTQVPAGIYEIEVVDLKPGKTKKGGPQIIFTYKVLDGEYKDQTFREYFQLTEQGKPWLKGRFVSLGCSPDQERYMKEDVLGVEAVAVLRETKDKNNPETVYVNVASIKLKGAEPKAGQAKPATATTKKRSGGDLL